jgi:hypothetical protein
MEQANPFPAEREQTLSYLVKCRDALKEKTGDNQ